ncbi:aldehyde dehydrogenase family protein [Nocardia sp. NPDC052278]|uniref:aldehyde dehydrogenase family protein n=1 Tax=unclassified Nocardia TaxID=2637762 RepID=UPI0036B0B36B
MSELFGAEPVLYIGGEARLAESGGTYPVIDPSTGEVIGSAADGQPADMERAIGAARTAFDTSVWSRDPELRRRVLLALADGLEKVKEEFRPTFLQETGIPLGAHGNFYDVTDRIRYWADFATSYSYEQEMPSLNRGGVEHQRLVLREPYGVVGVITPWNSPFQLNLMKIAPLLAAGNAIVLKPAIDTPWSGTIIGRVAASIPDLPPGIVNVVTSGANEVGDVLTGHPAVDGITFTGSTAVGRHIGARAAQTMKKVTLELGGKSANILLDDIDVAATADAAARWVSLHAGQGCMLITRLIVPRKLQGQVVDAVADVMRSLPDLDVDDPAAFIGPLINQRQHERVLGYVQSGIDQGATLVTGGRVPPGRTRGYFVEPTLFTDTTPDMKIVREEIFGPVLVVQSYDTLDEAVELANGTEYGLSSSVTGGPPEVALALARRLQAGSCAINGGAWFGLDTPFGGYKQSGTGYENGVWGFEEFLQLKAVARPVG